MRRLTGVLAALVMLAACGGAAETGNQAARVEPSPTPSPTPTPSPVAVSLQTTCDMLFLQGEPRLWTRATDLVAQQSNEGTWDTDEAVTVTARLEPIAASSDAEIKPFVEQMAEATAALARSAVGDVATYRTAATEVANICTPYVALDG